MVSSKGLDDSIKTVICFSSFAPLSTSVCAPVSTMGSLGSSISVLRIGDKDANKSHVDSLGEEGAVFSKTTVSSRDGVDDARLSCVFNL